MVSQGKGQSNILVKVQVEVKGMSWSRLWCMQGQICVRVKVKVKVKVGSSSN